MTNIGLFGILLAFIGWGSLLWDMLDHSIWSAILLACWGVIATCYVVWEAARKVGGNTPTMPPMVPMYKDINGTWRQDSRVENDMESVEGGLELRKIQKITEILENSRNS